MKKVVIVATLIMLGGVVCADGHLKFGSPEGDWGVRNKGLFQKDADAPRAKTWVRVFQDGSMNYEFIMKYEGGAEDGHGGVGIHILSDTMPVGKSWGMGDSWLLWLNYDTSPISSDIPEGLSAQVYKSSSDSDMELIDSISLRDIEPLAVRYLYSEIPVKLTYVASLGRILIADPRGKTAGWYIDLPGGQNETGQYVAVRTNGVRISFTAQDVEL